MTESLSTVSNVGGIPTFVKNIMVPSGWDQTNLVALCANCNSQTMRITYQFKRQEDPELVHVIGMVGLVRGDYIPMMWETYLSPDHDTTYFDFKYTYKNMNWGLNKAAILTKQDLLDIFNLYGTIKGLESFP